MPHLVVDPVVGAAQVVLALQTLVSRRISPLASLVVSVSSIRGGSGTTNVIPDQVELLGTVRTLSAEVWQEVPRWLEETARSAAASAGCAITLDYRRGYPVLVNDRAATARARASVRTVFGDTALVADAQPWMAAEDFARYAGERPACYVFLGVGNTARGIVSPNHATDFDVDEAVLHRGTAWFVGLAAGA
jgi:amidohydrolase